MWISDFSEVAGKDFSIALSPSLKQREDQSLKDVVVLMADVNHADANVQAPTNSLLKISTRERDYLLAEVTKGDETDEDCRGLRARGVRCHGIDNSPARAELGKTFDEQLASDVRIVELAIGKTVDLPSGCRRPSFDELKGLGLPSLRNVLARETTPLRDAVFRNEIGHYSAEADGHTIFVVLGRQHVDNIKAWLLESHDAIVLYPKNK
jgi:hypothetical protein